jgi:hypothetical protein
MGMSELEKSILGALIDLEKGVETVRTAQPKPDLSKLLARVDELAHQLPRGADPNLLHYLQRKSYQKARLLLEGRDAENARGACH